MGRSLRFSPCRECEYLVEQGREHCPNCGISLEEASLVQRLFRRVETRNPENYQAVESSVQAEIERLESNITDFKKAREPLTERIRVARQQGRDASTLQAAADEVEVAIGQAQTLLQKYRTLLAGIELERRHNAIRVSLAELEDLKGDASDPSLLGVGAPLRAMPVQDCGPLTHLYWLPGGALVGLTKKQLIHWPPDTQAPTRHSFQGDPIAVAGRDDGTMLAISTGSEVLIFDVERLTFLLPAHPSRSGRPPTIRCLCFSPKGDQLFAGGDSGELYRFSIAADPAMGFPPALRGCEKSAHPFGLSDIAISPDGQRMVTCGGGQVVTWWLTRGGLMRFSERAIQGVTRLSYSADGQRLAIGYAKKIGVWDAGVTNLEGEFPVDIAFNELVASPDGLRVLFWVRGQIWIGSPLSRAAMPILPADGRATAAALEASSLRWAVARQTPEGQEVVLRDLGRVGVVGWTLHALAEVQRSLSEAKALLAEGPTRGVAAAALRSQLRTFVRDAALSAVFAVTKRVQVIEAAVRAGADPDSMSEHLQILFIELQDVEHILAQAADFAPSLEKSLVRLRRLPIAVLLGQVDGIIQHIQTLFHDARGADEAWLTTALERLRADEIYASELQRIAHELPGPFWGSPDRARLDEALSQLRAEFPTIVDTMVAHSVTATVGRLDGLEADLGLEILRARQDRIDRRMGGGDIATEAEVLLDDLVHEDDEHDRGAALRSLDAARREIGIETDAFLETHQIGSE